MRNAEEIHHRSPIIHHIHISSLELRVKKRTKKQQATNQIWSILKKTKKYFATLESLENSGVPQFHTILLNSNKFL